MFAEGEQLPQDFLDYIRQDTRTAADVMVRHVITVGPDTPLPEIAEMMVKHGVSGFPC